MVMTADTCIGFIGAGNMAEALVRGLIAARTALPERILIYDVSAPRCEQLHGELGVTAVAGNRELVGRAGVVMLAVKPQNLADVLADVKGLARPEQLFVSILAGVGTERLEEGLAHDGCPSPHVVRVMPNTPALLQEGASALTGGRYATQEDLALARTFFETVGKTEIVEGDQMDAITGLTGSGPAYVFRMIEAMIEAGVALGLPREKAEVLVKQTVYGAALMARDGAESPAELRRRVTSPGGTTAAGLKAMDEQGFSEIVIGAVQAAAKRSEELGRAS
ncbi:MAG: pyrroline-5-carboxylate reductase, partial [Candidatus Sumerlaeota bacterium]|nr:pyrroline-5-carboxylate reductase [Candidatus Sumerlaeota bacterium]